ncbi:uncharacterized protein LOC141613494 [Silene latifolia]|uniref:uncharacterized protein LOC141613494 n=1 Tax=Silene latifolia TaxID=37657 RepID=UPI003D7784F8
MRAVDMGERMEFMRACCAIWEKRNKAIFEGEEWRADVVVNRTKELLVDIQQGCAGNGELVADVELCTGWIKPAEGVKKINVDAGCMEGVGVGWGAVCSDTEGKIEWCGVVRDKRSMAPQEAEAMAILIGFQEARRRENTRVLVENDCLDVVKDSQMRKTGRNEIFLVYDDIFSICSQFEQCSFAFVRRNFNRVAHELAHYAPWMNRDESDSQFRSPPISAFHFKLTTISSLADVD